MEFFKKPIVILVFFTCFKTLQTFLSFAHGEEIEYIPWVRLGLLAMTIVLSVFVVQEKQIALWAMGLLLVSNIFAVFWGIFLIPFHQYILKSVTVLLGSYFVYGGFVFIQQARYPAGRGITNLSSRDG